MLDRLFGESASRILLYLDAVEEGCAPEIATNFDFAVSAIQRQLRNLEHAGMADWTHANSIEYLPDEEQKRYYSPRTRPRRAGKPQ